MWLTGQGFAFDAAPAAPTSGAAGGNEMSNDRS